VIADIDAGNTELIDAVWCSVAELSTVGRKYLGLNPA
jgi:hypothetical protein